jgi:hypothetical protein
MVRFAWFALLVLTACSSTKIEGERAKRGYQGTVERVFLVVRQSGELPGIQQFMGRLRNALGPAVRPNSETNQYVVRTPKGQIIAQSDEEFPVGECVQVIPQGDSAGPAFSYGEAQVVLSYSCS